jgi:hypothetical protein
MKKFLLIIGLLFWVNMMFSQTATITVGSVYPAGPGTVSVPLTLTAIDNPNPYGMPDDLISGFALYMEYDPSVLGNVVTFTTNPFWTSNGTLVTNVIIGEPAGKNTIAFVWATGGEVVGTAGMLFCNMNFTYPSGTWPITWGIATLKGEGADVKIQSYMVDYDGNDYMTTFVDGGIYGPGGCTPGLWTGGGDGTDWFDAANWDCGEVPVNIDVEIPGGTKAFVTISGGIATTAALTVGAGGGVIVAPNGGLTTNGLFTNNGDFIVNSDAGLGYMGTFIDNGGLAGGGNFQFNRNVVFSGTVGGSSSNIGWHYLSSPVNGFTTDNLPDYFVNAWSQNIGQWIQYSMNVPCTPWPTTPLSTMDAWSVNRDINYPYPICAPQAPATGVQVEFIAGAPGVHTGAYNKPLGYGAAGYQAWNMVANPYPSGLNMNAIVWGPNTYQAAYFFEGSSGNYYYWATGMGAYSFPPTNGFMVETVAPDAFNVSNAMRSHNADFFYKNEVENLLTIKASGSERSDILHVRFADNVTAGLDLNGDAHKLFATTEGLPQIYTVTGEEMLAINALPQTPSVPMGFTANGSGAYTIEAIETSDFENVVLEDLFTGIKTDLLANTYTFEYNVDDNANRFVIHFTPLGTPELKANSINIWAANQTIYVQAPATTGDILVYNMMGQVVVKTGIVPGLNEIPMNNANTYYIVKVVGSDVTETGKVFIK